MHTTDVKDNLVYESEPGKTCCTSPTRHQKLFVVVWFVSFGRVLQQDLAAKIYEYSYTKVTFSLHENINVLLVFCNYSSPVLKREEMLLWSLSIMTTSVIILLVPFNHSSTQCCHTKNYSLCTKPYYLYYLNSGAVPGTTLKNFILCVTARTSCFLWDRPCIIASQFHCGLQLCSSPCQFVCHLTPHRHRTLRSLSVADRMCDSCIAHWWQPPLILLALPNYHLFFCAAWLPGLCLLTSSLIRFYPLSLKGMINRLDSQSYSRNYKCFWQDSLVWEQEESWSSL